MGDTPLPESTPAAPEPVPDTCAICLDPMEDSSIALEGCGHRFHARCIVPALQHCRACPLCRYAPRLPDPDYGTPAPSEEPSEASDDDSADARQWLARRRRAIWATMARVRRGTATPRAAAAATAYRVATRESMRVRKEQSRVRRESRSATQAYARQISRVLADHRRTTTQIRHNWARCSTHMQRLSTRILKLGDQLAADAGWDPAS